jgi:protoheme IX farnesyltransferase
MTAPTGTPRPLAADLLTLTKPRIISLLLVTTVMPMYAAGSPSLASVLIVLVGGYLMAGGANAVNMYFDRTSTTSWPARERARFPRAA